MRVDDVENAHDAIATAHGEHVALVAKVHCEARATKIADLRTGPEIVLAVKDFDLIVARTSSHN